MQEDDDTPSNPLNDNDLPVADDVQLRDYSVPLDSLGDADAPYQDDLDTDDNLADPMMDEETDDPTEILQVPPEEFKHELDKYDTDNVGDEADDRRESIEDLDEDGNDSAANA